MVTVQMGMNQGRGFVPPGLQGLGWLGDDEATPTPGTAIAESVGTGAAAAAAIGVGGLSAAAYGGLIGGVSANSWRGAGTGALLGSGLSLGMTGIGLLAGGLTGFGLVSLGAGAGLSTWAFMRWRRGARGGRRRRR